MTWRLFASIERRPIIIRGGHAGAPRSDSHIGVNVTDAAVAHCRLHRSGAVERIDIADVLLIAHKAALRRMERLRTAAVAAIIAAPLAIDIVRSRCGVIAGSAKEWQERLGHVRAAPNIRPVLLGADVANQRPIP